jgi:L-lysine 6-transaminase
MSIAPVLAETPSTRNRTPKSEAEKPLAPAKVLETIEQHVLLDGFKIVVDLDKSRGSYLQNRVDNRRLIDLYGFWIDASRFNHPHFDDPKYAICCARRGESRKLDVSGGYAGLSRRLSASALCRHQRYLFIQGGALAVEIV